MHGFKELAVLESNTCKHIYTPVTFSLNGITQKLNKAALDTGCNKTLIPAQLLDLGMPRDEAKELLLMSNNVPIAINYGVEGALEDKSDLLELASRLNACKHRCWLAKLSQADTDKYIKENITEAELSRVKNSKFTRFRVRVLDFKVANIQLNKCPICIAFGLSESSVLIGMEIIQLLYMQTFRVGSKQYTFISNRDNKDKVERAMSSAMRMMINENKSVKDIPLH